MSTHNPAREAARYALHVEKRLEAEVSVFTREISALRSRLAEYEKPVTSEEWENAIANLRMAQRYISHSSVPTPPLTAQMKQVRTAAYTIFNRMRSRRDEALAIMQSLTEANQLLAQRRDQAVAEAAQLKASIAGGEFNDVFAKHRESQRELDAVVTRLKEADGKRLSFIANVVTEGK